MSRIVIQSAPSNNVLKTDVPKASRPLQEQGPRRFWHAASTALGVTRAVASTLSALNGVLQP